MQPAELVALLSEAARASDPMAAVRGVLESLKDDLDAVQRALAYLPGTGGNANQAFYRASDLSLLKVSFPNGRRTPPHNHGTWANILLLAGCEKNTLYRRTADERLEREREVILEPGSIVTIPANMAHVAECLGDEPAIGLHVYGTNVLGADRLMWDPETVQAETLDWRKYEPLAQKASAMASAP
ncbi:MAG: cysteine dioxygenase family protein [Alphaproteobacteria bacterium]|nr:cysteine dioxygenase family protein [Alphaproteobacteria bacterium]